MVKEFAEAGEVGAGVGIFLGGEDAAAGVGDGAVGAAEGLADGAQGEVWEEFTAEGHGDLTRPGGFAVPTGTAGERGRNAVEVGDGDEKLLEAVVGKIKIKIKIRSRIKVKIRIRISRSGFECAHKFCSRFVSYDPSMFGPFLVECSR